MENFKEKPTPEQLSALLRKPRGEEGITVGTEMNKSNASLYDLTFSTLQFQDYENVLEIGFGNGKFFGRYSAINLTVQLTGLDYSELMCEEARKRNPDLIANGTLKIKHGDALSSGFPDNEFDKVIALNTIYFWEPLEDHFLEIKRILKPGGLFLVGFRPKDAVQDFEFVKYNFNLYELEDLKEIAVTCGFHVFSANQAQHQKSYKGREFTVKDICLVLEK